MEIEQDEGIEYRVFTAARDGDSNIRKLLDNRPRAQVQRILETKTLETGQCTTPFLIAARNGHVSVVDILLREYGAEIEQVGTVQFDGYTIDGATALWCSAGAGHFDVVKLLFDLGADVNHATYSNSTPLRAACFDGRIDIVKFLVRHGADINIPNKYNNTCLMIACYKGHKDVVSYLLQHGANPDDKAHCGATALHFAAERGHLEIAKKLIQHDAKLLVNEHGLSPLHLSAESSKADIVEFFISLPGITRTEYIEALELLGASYANDKDNYNMEKCYQYLWLAMLERHSQTPPLEKKVLPPVEAYDNRVECQTVAQLDALRNNNGALHMEALIVRERILGEDNAEIPHPIVFRGAVFADVARFDRCISLWMRALYLRQKNNRSISKDLLRFAQVFSQMLHVGVDLEFIRAKFVFECALNEFSKDLQRREQQESSSEDKTAANEVFEVNMHTALYLLEILTKLKSTEQEYIELCKLAYRFNKMSLKLKTNHNASPLHMACDESTTVDDFHVNDIVRFPSDALARLLIICGADVNIVDDEGNTPLHYIVKYNRPISDFLTLHNIIIALSEAGCHMDQTNKAGETAFQVSTTGVAEIILRTKRNLQLKCLAAAAVKKYRLDYRGQIPCALEEFVELH